MMGQGVPAKARLLEEIIPMCTDLGIYGLQYRTGDHECQVSDEESPPCPCCLE